MAKSKFAEAWKASSPYSKEVLAPKEVAFENYDAGPGEVFNICVEYKDKEGRLNYRFFNSDAELQQFKQEMGVEVTVTTRGIDKSIVEKPAKFDRCVREVQQRRGADNAYAVCNAMLSDKSFSGMEDSKLFGLIDRALKDMGIVAAGPIPASLLARQDLEGSTSKVSKAIDDSEDDSDDRHEKRLEFTPMHSLVSRIKANQKPKFTAKAGETFKDIWSRVRVTNKVKN